nr:MAG TPA: hypothetical protein [Caudoviricetes sp.]
MRSKNTYHYLTIFLFNIYKTYLCIYRLLITCILNISYFKLYHSLFK